MTEIATCLWFESEAEEAAKFYVSLLPDSRIDAVQRNVSDGRSGTAGSVLIVSFTVGGAKFLALNGGEPAERNHSVSISITCDHQGEVDRLWEALCANGGQPVQCGWIKDRWGFSWQIVPRVLMDLLADPDAAKAQRVMGAMMSMIKIESEGLLAAARGGIA